MVPVRAEDLSIEERSASGLELMLWNKVGCWFSRLILGECVMLDAGAAPPARITAKRCAIQSASTRK
eukprot:COSAG05_NODE_17970_length_316_cov_0.714286_1_plen_66_part_10